MAFGAAAVQRWLHRRWYQYNVTLPLYMLSPTERFVFNSIIFLITAMIVIAAILYLPEHVATIAARVGYYWHGSLADAESAAPGVARGLGATVRATVTVVEASVKTGTTAMATAVGMEL